MEHSTLKATGTWMFLCLPAADVFLQERKQFHVSKFSFNYMCNNQGADFNSFSIEWISIR